jgi:hypothetical protein
MTLSPVVCAAARKVAAHLRDPIRESRHRLVGSMMVDAMPSLNAVQRHAMLDSLRLALGLSPVPGNLARWATGKSREEVAAALEQVATSVAPER